MKVDVNYRPTSTGSYTAGSGVSIKVLYRYATDSSWTDVANTNFNPSQFTINAANTYTTSFSTTKAGDLYVRAMIMDRPSSSYSIPSSKTCADNAGSSHTTTMPMHSSITCAATGARPNHAVV